MDILSVFAIACFGSSLQELSYWYDARSKLNLKKYKAMLKSKGYWIITIAMIIGAGIGTLIWTNFNFTAYEAKDYFLYGAAFPLIFKKAVGTVSKIAPTRHLGADDHSEDEFSVKDQVNNW